MHARADTLWVTWGAKRVHVSKRPPMSTGTWRESERKREKRKREREMREKERENERERRPPMRTHAFVHGTASISEGGHAVDRA